MNTLSVVHPVEIESSFQFDNCELNSLTIDAQVWFIAKEVCDILRYTNSRKAINDHVRPQNKKIITKDVLLTCNLGVCVNNVLNLLTKYNGKFIIINEVGLYELILKSKMPKAERFKLWVTEEVLPSIRKTGNYITNPQNTPKLIEHTQEQLDQMMKKVAYDAAREVQLQSSVRGVTAGRPTKAGFIRPQFALDTATDFIRSQQMFDLDLVRKAIDERGIYKEIIEYVRANSSNEFENTPDHELLDYAYVYRLVYLRKMALKLLDRTDTISTKERNLNALATLTNTGIQTYH